MVFVSYNSAGAARLPLGRFLAAVLDRDGTIAFATLGGRQTLVALVRRLEERRR